MYIKLRKIEKGEESKKERDGVRFGVSFTGRLYLSSRSVVSGRDIFSHTVSKFLSWRLYHPLGF